MSLGLLQHNYFLFCVSTLYKVIHYPTVRFWYNCYIIMIKNHYPRGYLQSHIIMSYSLIFIIYEYCTCSAHWSFSPSCLCVCSKLSKLELLEEINLSGNKLKTIPSTVSSCKRLHTLIAHSNHITVFPEILNLPEIKVRLVLFFFLFFFFAWPVCVWFCSACVSLSVFCTFVACRSKL